MCPCSGVDNYLVNYGNGDDPLYFESVGCLGNETHIENCDYNTFVTASTCTSNTSFAAGLDCSGKEGLHKEVVWTYSLLVTNINTCFQFTCGYKAGVI